MLGAKTVLQKIFTATAQKTDSCTTGFGHVEVQDLKQVIGDVVTFLDLLQIYYTGLISDIAIEPTFPLVWTSVMGLHPKQATRRQQCQLTRPGSKYGI
jgi:hypothetical protein